MTTPAQYPTAQLPETKGFAVGGQFIYEGYLCNVTKTGFKEIAEDKQNPDGSHRAKMVYSRRPTAALDLEALDGKDGTELRKGGAVTINAIIWNIESVEITNTSHPIMLTMSLIGQVEDLGVGSEMAP